MAVDNKIVFGGVDSSTYNIYISGEGVFNAPKRDVEMITIPGRNGAFVLDNGRFENITVTYPAFTYETSMATFKQNLANFRNALASKKGYQRLTDTFHTDEYRMAAFIDGIEIKPIKYNTASEFTITFDCKPQRWLVSGETAVTVTSGDTLTNPTLFESGPLLEVGGSGSIQFNGYEVSFEGIPYGEIVIGEKGSYSLSSTATVALDTSLLNAGDPIYPEIKECVITAFLRTGDLNRRFTDVTIYSTTNVLEASFETFRNAGENRYLFKMLVYPDFGAGFVYGTAATISCIADYRYKVNSGSTNYHEQIEITIDYGGADTYTVTVSRPSTLPTGIFRVSPIMKSPTMYGDSSQPNSAPIFIDCDLGEAYTDESGVYRSLNSYIDLGSDLPKLGVGENEITFDNTIVNFKIAPRWWKV